MAAGSANASPSLALPTQEDLFSYFSKYSNWNRWGPDDVKGTLNHITPAHVLAAKDLIKSGKLVSLAWDVEFNAAKLPKDANPAVGVPQRHMHSTGGDNGLGTAARAGSYLDSSGGITSERSKAVASRPFEVEEQGATNSARGSGSAESISFTFHGYTFTHLDSLAHMFWDGFTYNGYNASQTVNLRQGASLLDVVAAAPGIVGRGVLLDAAEVGFGRGGSGNVDEKTGLVERWMEPGEFVTGEDLEAIAKKQGVEVRAGDLIFLRTGYGLKKRLHGPDDTSLLGRAGYHPSCLPYFHTHSISLISCDTAQDAHPHAYPAFRSPVHTIGIVAMGLWLLDNADLEELARVCRKEGRYEFFVSVQPCRFRGVTGSPVSPVAIF